MLSYGPEEDESFLSESGVLDDVVTYVPGTIEVVPGPATLLLMLGGIVLARHRR
jgi:hypothetical protein